MFGRSAANTIRIGKSGTHNKTFIAGISGVAVTGSARLERLFRRRAETTRTFETFLRGPCTIESFVAFPCSIHTRCPLVAVLEPAAVNSDQVNGGSPAIASNTEHSH